MVRISDQLLIAIPGGNNLDAAALLIILNVSLLYICLWLALHQNFLSFRKVRPAINRPGLWMVSSAALQTTLNFKYQCKWNNGKKVFLVNLCHVSWLKFIILRWYLTCHDTDGKRTYFWIRFFQELIWKKNIMPQRLACTEQVTQGSR